MKNIVKNRVVLLVTFLIVMLSFGLSIANYWSAFEQTRKQLTESSLPLSTDNIYTDIQKVIIEPSLISSMMSSDTFVRDWLKNDEDNVYKIIKYLDTVKEKYGFSNTFLVSASTEKYYTSTGFLETLSPDKVDNQWYYRFSEQPQRYEINIDNNELIDNNLLLFFNYKIFNERGKLLGVVGVIFKTDYISEMFLRFREFYNLNVFLMDSQGDIKLSEDGITGEKKLSGKRRISGLLPEIINKKSIVSDIKIDSNEYLVKSKYIDELGLFLVVEAELSRFTSSLQHQLIGNLAISLLITLVIIAIILRTISSYTWQLNQFAHHDDLTGLPNRRTFNINLKKVWQQYQRDKREKCLIFFDIDNFKIVNDTYGHPLGDKVLVRVGGLLREYTRSSDYLSRWGGEEFSVLLIDSDLNHAVQVADKLRCAIESDKQLSELAPIGITASFGVSTFVCNDSLKDILSRSDQALYDAKHSGKNCVKSLPIL